MKPSSRQISDKLASAGLYNILIDGAGMKSDADDNFEILLWGALSRSWILLGRRGKERCK